MLKPRVVVAEDNLMIRECCLFPILAGACDIVDVVEDGEAAVRASQAHRPDIVLLDIGLSGMGGFDAGRLILAENPQTKVVFVSNYAERTYVEAALRMGAAGYVLKSRIILELLGAIDCALQGEFFVSTF